MVAVLTEHNRIVAQSALVNVQGIYTAVATSMVGDKAAAQWSRWQQDRMREINIESAGERKSRRKGAVKLFKQRFGG